MTAFEKRIRATLPARVWPAIAARWLAGMPKQVKPTVPPEETVGELQTLLIEVSEAEGAGEEPTIVNVPGLQETVFLEAAFLFAKAANVNRAAETHASQGMPTWSLSSAYHSAFFGAKAVTRLLGVATFRVNEQNWILDVFGTPASIGKRVTSADSGVVIRNLKHSNIGHRHEWQILQRLLRTTSFSDGVAKRFASALGKLSHEEIAAQRNRIHYENNSWEYDDLYQSLVVPGFGVRDVTMELENEHEEKDFSMLLSAVVLELGHRMLDSIESNKLRDLRMAFSDFIDRRHCPIYHEMKEDCFIPIGAE